MYDSLFEFKDVTEEDIQEILYQVAVILYRSSLRGRFRHRHKRQVRVRHAFHKPLTALVKPVRNDPATYADVVRNY